MPFSDVMFGDFEVKKYVFSINRQKYSFEWKIKQKLPKDVFWTGLKDSYLGFSKFWVFDPQNFKKPKILEIFKKNPHFSKFSKNRNIC